MLIRFTVANFRSFYEEAALSMYPGPSKEHSQHILNTPDTSFPVLRTALMYGANAAGKSNVIKAMHFARNLITQGTKPRQRIAIEPFKLDPTATQQPSRFEFEFIVNDIAYAYGFTVDSQQIQTEWLYQLIEQHAVLIFERTAETSNTVHIQFNFEHDLFTKIADEEKQFLNFVARGTRPNQLFLNQVIEENVSYFVAIFNWFAESLVIIFPDSKLKGMQFLVHKDADFKQALTRFLQQMYTGVEQVSLNEIDKDDTKNFPKDLLEEALSELKEDSFALFESPNGRYLAELAETGHAKLYVLSTMRSDSKQQAVHFNIYEEESDGTRRLFDLFPILHSAKNTVFVIDELERSLHPNLVYQFMQYSLQTSTFNQIIVSTHESTLLDLNLLRRDEIWFVEKHNKTGQSTLYSLEEFSLREGLNIHKGYLQGRFGAIPILGHTLILGATAEPTINAS